MEREKAKAMWMQTQGWTEAQFVEREEWAKENCICGTCPTYVNEEQQCAFCWPTVGRSDIIGEERNCYCGQCPVFNMSDWRFAYYCTRDSEISQMMEVSGEAAA